MDVRHAHEAPCYRIQVQGELDSRWSDHFAGLAIASEAGVTTISGSVVDQAALHGLLTRIRDLGLPLLLVERIAPEFATSFEPVPATSNRLCNVKKTNR